MQRLGFTSCTAGSGFEGWIRVQLASFEHTFYFSLKVLQPLMATAGVCELFSILAIFNKNHIFIQRLSTSYFKIKKYIYMLQFFQYVEI